MITELIALLKSGLPMTIRQLADKLGTTCDVVQDMLDMLVKKGMAEKVEACAASSACGKCRMKCGCKQTGSGSTQPGTAYKLTSK